MNERNKEVNMETREQHGAPEAPRRVAIGQGLEGVRFDDRGTEEGEAERKFWPRIYVASLADYNAGILHGAWIEAAQDPECLEMEVKAMLERSRQPGAEEWAIHDTDEFGPVRLSAWERLRDVSTVAKGLQEHGVAFGHYVNFVGTDEEYAAGFADAYLGRWDSLKDYARQVVDDLRLEEELDRAVPERLRPYVKVDVERVRDDLMIELNVAEDAEGVWVFRPTSN